MKLARILALLALLLCCAQFLEAQQGSAGLTNDDIITMVAGGLDESLVIGAINANNDSFDVSAKSLLALKRARIGDKIIQAMLAAQAKKHNPPPTPASAQAPTAPASIPGGAMPMTPAAINPMLSQGAAAQAMAIEMMTARGMSPQMMTQIDALQRGRGMGMLSGPAMNAQAAMVAGDLDPSQLPKVYLLHGDRKEALNRSITEIAKSEIKGGRSAVGMGPMSAMAALGMRGGMGGFGGGLSMMGGLGGAALRFAPVAAGPGVMFAGPAMSLATGLLGGGLTHHSSMPKATYVWALPGAHSSYVLSVAKPRFEIEFGNIVGIDPDAFEPALVKLTQSNDNWRLVGATKETLDKHGNEKQSAIAEERTEIKTTSLGRGHVIIEAAAGLAGGEFGIVLHPTRAQKATNSASAGLTAEQTIFYSVWDFSVPANDVSSIPH